MGLPEVLINFKNDGVSAITRSGRGVVALIVKDDTHADITMMYKKVTDVNSAHYTADNLKLIQLAFMAAPSKVIVERLAVSDADYSKALRRLENRRFNYLAVPGISDSATAEVVTWIKACRDQDKKTFKAVLPKAKADHEGVINFATDNLKVGETTYTCSQYTARIAGMLAAVPLSRSVTYQTLPEVEQITDSADPNTEIDQGAFILIHDGEKVKVGRGVNSLISSSKMASLKKIKIVEAMDLMRDDIRKSFEEGYVGSVINNGDNKALFVAAINAYLKELSRADVLDASFENKAEVDLESTTIYLASSGKNVDEMTDEEVKKANTGSKVFVKANVKFVDAMEDVQFEINM